MAILSAQICSVPHVALEGQSVPFRSIERKIRMKQQNHRRRHANPENHLATTGQMVMPRIKDPDTRTITQSEAARRLQVSRTTVYRMAKDGLLASVPMRGRTRIVLASVFAYVGNFGKEDANV